MLAGCQCKNITEFYAAVLRPGSTELMIVMELMACSVADLVSALVSFRSTEPKQQGLPSGLGSIGSLSGHQSGSPSICSSIAGHSRRRSRYQPSSLHTCHLAVGARAP